MQSFLDPSLAGYYFDTPTNVIDYEVFGNTGLDHTTKIVLSFAHLLWNVQEASRYSLRNFFDENKYIVEGLEYDLDLVN